MKFLHNRVTIYVPKARMTGPMANKALAVGAAAGGSTSVEGWGVWDGVMEEVFVITAFYSTDTKVAVLAALDALIDALHAAGEVEVLVDYGDKAVLV